MGFSCCPYYWGCPLYRDVYKASIQCISESRFIKHAGFYCKLNKERRLNKTILLQWNNSKNLLFCRKTGFWSNIPFNTNPNPNLNLRAFLFVRPGHIYSRPLSTQVYYSNGQFICYAWPHRPSTTQADYSITALHLFVMHGHKGPQLHRLITA